MKRFLIIICCLLFVSYSVAQTSKVNKTVHDGETYDVTTDETFVDVSIESGGVLTVKSGATLTVTGTLDSPNVTCLIIEDGGQLINGDGGFPGSSGVYATVRKNITSFNEENQSGWYTLSSPLASSILINNVGGLVQNNGSEYLYDLYRYAEKQTNMEWQSALIDHKPPFSSIDIGRGYLYASTVDNHICTFAGVLQYEQVYSANFVTYASSNQALKGWNLIGNPYPHNIYKGKYGANDCGITPTNIISGYYIVDINGGFIVHEDNQPIAPCQAVLIKLSAKLGTGANSNKLMFNKTTHAPSGSKDSNVKSLQIDVNGMERHDRAFVFCDEEDGLDKMDHVSELIPSLSIYYENKKYAIAHIGNNSSSFDVLFKNTQAGFYTLSVDTRGNSFGYLHLIDNFTGEEIDLLEEPNYKFYAFGNEGDGRFRIILNPNGIDSEESEFAYISNGEIIITGLNGNATLQVFDVMGRLINEEVVCGTSGMICRANKPNTTGVYLLRMMVNEDVKTQKLIVE